MTERERAEILELAREHGASEVSSALIVIVIIWIVIGWLVPAVVAMRMMSDKGQSRGLGFIMGLGLSWIGVIIVACKPNLKVGELSSVPPPSLPFSVSSSAIPPSLPLSAPQPLPLSAPSSPSSPPPIPISAPFPLSSYPPPLPVTAVAELAEAAEVPPPLPDEFVLPPFEERPLPNFRLEVLRSFKSAGVVFDEYDIELAIEELRVAHMKSEELRRAEYMRDFELRRAEYFAELERKRSLVSEFLSARQEVERQLELEEWRKELTWKQLSYSSRRADA